MTQHTLFSHILHLQIKLEVNPSPRNEKPMFGSRDCSDLKSNVRKLSARRLDARALTGNEKHYLKGFPFLIASV